MPCSLKRILAVAALLPLLNASAEAPRLLAHFMPWHQTPQVSGYWGYHWTMRHFDPEKTDADGRRQIASHYYPLTGPYDSQDPFILEYQVLLMKIAGIDGVAVDWYGFEPFWDYGVLNESTHALHDWTQRAGLSFCIVYEDQTVKHMVNNGRLSAGEALAHSREVMQYLQSAWFSSADYVRINGRPLLMVFGPQYFMESSDWMSMFSVLPETPFFATLDNRLGPAASAAFPWPPMWKSNAQGILTRAALDEYLTQFYNKSKAWPAVIGGAFPGFHDIYKEAGVGAGYGVLDHENGAVLRYTLETAIRKGSAVIQLITWNDYGEGTMIEPTVEFGYSFLEIVQQLRRDLYDSTFPFRAEHLRLPMRILEMRRAYTGDGRVNADLDRVFSYIAAGDIGRATTLLDKLPSAVGRREEPTNGGVRIGNFPNPFNSETTIVYELPQAAEVELTIYSADGRVMQRLAEGVQPAGRREVKWGQGVPSGIYIYRLTAGERSATGKCLLLK